MKVNDIMEGRVECNSIIKNFILKNNSTEIDEEYLNILINNIKEMKIEKCSNINYYFQRKETYELINEINNRWILSGSRMDYLQDDMKRISMVMHLYLQNKIIGDKFDEIKEILKKINRLEDLVKGRKWYRIKCIMKLKEYDEEGIKVKTLERIKYIKYMMTMIKERIKFNKDEIIRINTNKIMFDSNKKIRIRKKDPKNEIYPNNDTTLEYWKSLYETQVKLNKEKWKIKQITLWNERYINYDNVIITINELNLSIMRISNWKAPGIDTIYGYYWKRMSSSREIILNIFNEWLNFPENIH